MLGCYEIKTDEIDGQVLFKQKRIYYFEPLVAKSAKDNNYVSVVKWLDR